MYFRLIYDEGLAAASYVIGCEGSGEAIVIDPLRDIDTYVTIAAREKMKIVAVADTHIHADFVSGSREAAKTLGAEAIVSGHGGDEWTPKWLDDVKHRIVRDGDTIRLGNVELKVVHCPGHTPEHVGYLVTDLATSPAEPMGMCTGDFVFVGDLGRPDLLESAVGRVGAAEPSARAMLDSVRRFTALPEFMQVWPAHGAGSACGKSLGAVPQSTVGYELRHNAAIKAASDDDDFVRLMLSGQPEPPPYFGRMKKWNVEGAPVLGDLPIPPTISADELPSPNDDSCVVLDIRSWDEFRAGHRAGALSTPVEKSFETAVGSWIREDQRVYLVGREDDVEEAVRGLIRVGVDNVAGFVDASGVAKDEVTPEIGVDEARVAIGEGRRVLDVRNATEYAEGHVGDATNVTHVQLLARLDEVPTGEPLLVYCRSGNRSARATALLRREGYDATNVAGGMLAWADAGAEVVR